MKKSGSIANLDSNSIDQRDPDVELVVLARGSRESTSARGTANG
jgi:hypothetical protein